MLTVTEAAHTLGLSEGRTRALIKSGKLLAEKRGRQWMVFERSVEQRRTSNVRPGRPSLHAEAEHTDSNIASEHAFSLYAECKSMFPQGGISSLIKGAQSDEERDFYVHVMNFFLARECEKLVAKGAY